MQFDEDKFRALTEGEPVRPEPRGFQPEQLIACPACERRNAPTRLNCLYCGEDLPPAEAADGDLRRPVLRPLEERDQGFN
ncbi:MAG: hypothetical protein ACRD9R_11950, partial [Pyrinomonadaceae bacterium]